MPDDSIPLAEYVKVQIEAMKELAAVREQHHRELREADQNAIRLLQESNADHFARLNENASRTIEERRHFVSVEVFDPFKDQVLTALARGTGDQAGSQRVIAVGITLAGLMLSLAGVVVLVVLRG